MAYDIFKILKINGNSSVLKKWCPDLIKITVENNGRSAKMNVISENDVKILIKKSKVDFTENFEKWLFNKSESTISNNNSEEIIKDMVDVDDSLEISIPSVTSVVEEFEKQNLFIQTIVHLEDQEQIMAELFDVYAKTPNCKGPVSNLSKKVVLAARRGRNKELLDRLYGQLSSDLID